MTVYIYPQNLKATATLWLWCLRDFAIICVGLLVSFPPFKEAMFGTSGGK